jgi:hypothetical protein
MKSQKIAILSILATIILLWSCGKKNPEVVIQTELGDITLELYPE